MIETLKQVAVVLGVVLALPGIFGIFFAVRFWFRPVWVSGGYSVGVAGDQIHAAVVNRTKVPIYLVSVQARCVYPWGLVVSRFLRRPVFKPRLWMRYGGLATYNLLPSSPMKVEAQQPVKLQAQYSSLPVVQFHAPLMQIEACLSSGRKVRSRPVRIPDGWLHPLAKAPLRAVRA